MNKGSINFFYEEIPSFVIQKRQVRNWIQASVQSEGYQVSSLNFIFCSDEYLLHINQQFLQHDFYTDIITFDQSESPQVVEGDIFISVDRVKSNSLFLNLPFENELYRVLIHGILHLIGYSDKSTDEKEIMREKESQYIQAFFHNHQ